MGKGEKAEEGMGKWGKEEKLHDQKLTPRTQNGTP